MNTKFCPFCSQENLLVAKFCMSCRSEFPAIAIKTSANQAPSTPKPKPQRLPNYMMEPGDEDVGELPAIEISDEASNSLANQLINYCEAQSGGRTVAKLGDVAATDFGKVTKRERRTVSKAERQSAKQILQSTKNSERAKK